VKIALKMKVKSRHFEVKVNQEDLSSKEMLQEIVMKRN
jgi:hypothetical protein